MPNLTKHITPKNLHKRKKHKYGAKKTVVDDITFDSILEARYYKQLKWLEQADQILFFRLQPRYLLQEAFEKGGKKHRKIEFVGDFEVHHKNGSIEVIDIKGAPPTEATKLKYKLFNNKYPHKLSIIGHSKATGFIDYEKLQKRKGVRK